MRLRKDGCTLLWIDQVCIDQSNSLERGHQVSIMKTIYQNASEVRVWLDPDEDNQGQAAIDYHREWVPFAQDFAKHIREGVDKGEFSITKSSTGTSEKLFGVAVEGQDDILLTYIRSHARYLALLEATRTQPSKEAAALEKWFNYELWSRCWVLQEIALNRRVYFLVGAAGCISKRDIWIIQSIWIFIGDAMETAAAPAISIGSGRECIAGSLSLFRTFNPPVSYSNMFSLIRAFETSLGPTLKNVLQISSCSMSTDLRDRVYAILGLVSLLQGILPDYRASTTHWMVFAQANKALISETRDLSILGAFSESKCKGVAHDMPSWSIDISHPFRTGPMPFETSVDALQITSLWFPSDFMPVFHADHTGLPDRILECSVIWLGDVDFATEIRFQDMVPDLNVISDFWFKHGLISAMQRYESGQKYQPTGQNIEHAIMDCIFCMDIVDTLESPTSMVARYDRVGRLATIQDEKWTFFKHHGPDPSEIRCIGFGPPNLEQGDEIVLPVPSKYPIFVRKLPGGPVSDYTLLGPAYMHGLDVEVYLKRLRTRQNRRRVRRIRIH